MERLIVFLFVAPFLLMLVGPAEAVPSYYTFEGNVTTITDPTGIIADSGLIIGSSVEYVFLIDFDEDGTETTYGGTVSTWTDSATQDYFYADYVSGSALEAKDGGYWSTGHPAADAERNWGLDDTTAAIGVSGIIHGNSADNSLYITHDTLVVSSWTVGTALQGHNSAYDSSPSPTFSHLHADLVLTDISAVPIPVPSAISLLGFGLIGLVRVRRKLK